MIENVASIFLGSKQAPLFLSLDAQVKLKVAVFLGFKVLRANPQLQNLAVSSRRANALAGGTIRIRGMFEI
jgi:hypothetical protein